MKPFLPYAAIAVAVAPGLASLAVAACAAEIVSASAKPSPRLGYIIYSVAYTQNASNPKDLVYGVSVVGDRGGHCFRLVSPGGPNRGPGPFTVSGSCEGFSTDSRSVEVQLRGLAGVRYLRVPIEPTVQ